ncbi:hypothetical protein BEU75_004405 [Salmonella enterica]|nr:hypothetical protein [Salmonella enterica]
MHKSVVTNNVYIEHRPHPHFCNAIKQGTTVIIIFGIVCYIGLLKLITKGKHEK